MNGLTKKETMTSLDIAEVTVMRHADVMRSIRNMEEALVKVSERCFALSSYKQDQPNGGYEELKKHDVLPMIEKGREDSV